MTYEEKLNIILEAINEARKIARKGHPIKLYAKTDSKLKQIILQEIHDILLKLQDDEKIIQIQDIPSELKPLQHLEITSIDYFLLTILDKFDEWYENYLLRQKSGISEMTYLNLVRLFDTMMAIKEKMQLNRTNTVFIPLLPARIYFQELLPYDTPEVRDEYIEGRWDAVKYLNKEGVVLEFKHINSMMHRWDDSVKVVVNVSPFYEFYEKTRKELEKRRGTDNKEQPKTKTIDKSETRTRAKVNYNPQKGELDIEGKKVKLNKDSFRAKLLELLLKDDKSRNKEWSWDEVIESIEDTKDEELTKENKNKFYPACDGLSKHIALKTGVNDLLIFNKSTVQINPKYL